MKKQSGLLLAKALLAAMRLGAMNIIACALLVLGVLAWGWIIPALRTELKSQQQAIADASKALDTAMDTPPAPPLTLAEERLAVFYDNLGERDYVEQQLKTLFAIASKNNLVLSQAEYKPAYNGSGRFHTYQILLPVKGPYPAIRQFCEQMLLAIPFASLDEMAFKRESVGNAALEAKLRFTLYLSGEPSRLGIAAGMKEQAYE